MHTAIPAGATLTLVYTATVDTSGGVAGASAHQPRHGRLQHPGRRLGAGDAGHEQRGRPEHRRRHGEPRQPAGHQDRRTDDAGDRRRHPHPHAAGHRPQGRDRLLAEHPGRGQQGRARLGPQPATVAAGRLRHAGLAGRLRRGLRAKRSTQPAATRPPSPAARRPCRQPRPDHALRVQDSRSACWSRGSKTTAPGSSGRPPPATRSATAAACTWNTTEPPVRPAATDRDAESALVQSNVDQPLRRCSSRR